MVNGIRKESGHGKGYGHIHLGYIDVDFGLFIPDPNGFKFYKQTGGLTCRRVQMQGYVIPIERPRLHPGRYPSWYPDGDDERTISDVDVTQPDDDDPDKVSHRDHEWIPEWVFERGHFYNYAEYRVFIEGCPHYGALDLVEHLTRWNYNPDGEIQHDGYTPTKDWDGLEEIWSEIDEKLPFEYETLSYEEAEEVYEGQPGMCEGVRWVNVTEVWSSKYGNWGDSLVGSTVAILYPNCD